MYVFEKSDKTPVKDKIYTMCVIDASKQTRHFVPMRAQ